MKGHAMLALYLIAVSLQALAMLVDELRFHRSRGLPRWERIGHPLDTLSIATCLIWLLVTSPDSPAGLPIYVGLAIASTLFVTKDEAVHARLCSPGEQWLHAVLFALHPIVLAAFGLAWWMGRTELLAIQLVLTAAVAAYQAVYWNVLVSPPRPRTAPGEKAVPQPSRAVRVNNTWYRGLGTRWYTADDTPIALLRAESRHRNPWIAQQLARRFAERGARVLDLGCGAGFLSNYLSAHGHRVIGLDTTPRNLDVARRFDRSRRVDYRVGDARALPFPNGSFDVVCAMDLLEHVEDPERVIAEASRVLRPRGLFFFHTFNRNWLANLVVIKGVEWFVKNTPKDLHVLRLFLTPEELTVLLRANALRPVELVGSRPQFGWPLWRMVATGRVGDDFRFTFTRSTKLGFTGFAQKQDSQPR